MTPQPWWECWPGRLDSELAALDAAGIRWQRNEVALARGVLCLDIVVSFDGDDVPLKVVFPDSYPYFRFQVYAPTLDLPYHQNPFEHNLCLLGRRTNFWNTTDTVASLIERQFPLVIATAHSPDGVTAGGAEQRQAEPFSDYFRYAPSMILVQSDWNIPPQHRSGQLLIGTSIHAPQRPNMLLRGAVLHVAANDGTILATACEGLRTSFSGRTVAGYWARVSSPIRHDHPEQFLKELSRQCPTMRDARSNHLQDDRWLRVWGVLFPEETAHRITGEGWMFVCECNDKHPRVVSTSGPHFASGSRKARRKK